MPTLKNIVVKTLHKVTTYNWSSQKQRIIKELMCGGSNISAGSPLQMMWSVILIAF